MGGCEGIDMSEWRTDIYQPDGTEGDLIIVKESGAIWRECDCRVDNGEWHRWFDGYGYEPVGPFDVVSHWMPIPELPL